MVGAGEVAGESVDIHPTIDSRLLNPDLLCQRSILAPEVYL
jgi:hypothetical protein